MGQRFEGFAVPRQQPVAKNVINRDAEQQNHKTGEDAGNHGQQRQLRQRIHVGELAAEEIEIEVGEFSQFCVPVQSMAAEGLLAVLLQCCGAVVMPTS